MNFPVPDNASIAVLISEMMDDFAKEEKRITSQFDNDPVAALRARELDLKAKDDARKFAPWKSLRKQESIAFFNGRGGEKPKNPTIKPMKNKSNPKRLFKKNLKLLHVSKMIFI